MAMYTPGFVQHIMPNAYVPPKDIQQLTHLIGRRNCVGNPCSTNAPFP